MQPIVVHVTDGGPHSAAKHAEITAWKILDLIRISEDSVDPGNPDRDAILAAREEARQSKARLRPLLEAALVPVHDTIVTAERKALAARGGAARLTAPPAEHGHADIDAVLGEVTAVLATTAIGRRFGQPEVQAVLRRLIADDFARAVHEERSWHADRRPERTGEQH